jgi:Tfp pilus assembly protein PilE
MTFVDLLVRVVILGIVMAIATPIFLSANTSAQQDQCDTNMRTIANLEDQYRMKNASHAYTTTLSNLSNLPPSVPLCPSGGTYTVTISDGTAKAQNGQTVPKGGLVISCSISSHGKYAPGIDSP